MTVTRSARTGLKSAIAASVAVGLMSTGVAFAASGHAPWSNGGAAATSTHAADPTHPTHPTHPTDDPSDDPSDSGSTGPDAHAFPGLCRAYSAGQKADHGKALESPAFSALVSAAGGADNVAAFCATFTTGPGASHPAHPTHPAKPTQAASPTHPAKPTKAASPTHPAKPTKVATPASTGKPHKGALPTLPTQAR